MAAAVPAFKVRAGGELAEAVAHADRVCVLYSPKDWVLRYAFRIGQTGAGHGEGFFPSALGHDRVPDVPGRVDWQPISGAGHGDYWGHSRKPAADIAADAIAAFFPFGSWERTLRAREAGLDLRPDVGIGRTTSWSRDIGATRPCPPV